MNIIYFESNYYTIYDTTTKILQTVYDSLEQILSYIKPYDCLLLPEHHFVFTSKQYSFYTNQAFTIKDSKKLIQEYVEEQRKLFPNINQLVSYDIHNISVDGIQVPFHLGHKWQLHFQLDCIFWNSNSEVDFEYVAKKKFNLLPLGFWTIKQCNTLVSDSEYSILYIHNTESKLILVKNGFYHHIELINFGKENLKAMYKEHHLLKYYWDPASTSPVTESIVKDITHFFAEKAIDWLSSFVSPNKNLLVISDITKNTYFMESFKLLFSKFINWYIIPVSLPNIDPGMPIDIATTMTHIIKKTVEK